MTEGQEIQFRIDAYTPDTLPMERLAEYMGDLAKILGETANVHFLRLEFGSTVLVNKIDDEAVHKVRDRVTKVRAGDGPAEAMAAYHRMNKRLLADDAVGVLTDEGGAEIIALPGREQVESVTFGAFNQEGFLDGQVIRLGGKQDQAPVHILAAERLYTHCFATHELVKSLAHHIYGPEIRVYGTGRWLRDEMGEWSLLRFTISSFEMLRDEPLSAAVARLRDVPGTEWEGVDDPWAELVKNVTEAMRCIDGGVRFHHVAPDAVAGGSGPD